MSYRDEYYNRTPEQEFHIYRDRERSWNVLRFFVALPGLAAVVGIFDHWYRMYFESAAAPITPSNNTQAVVHMDMSCLYVPLVILTLLLGAAMLRAMVRSGKDKRSRPEAAPQKPAFPLAHAQKNNAQKQDPSADVDDLVREVKQRRERQLERESLLAKARRQKREEQERVRQAQSERLVASARHSLAESIETRVAEEKRREEQWSVK